jgi:hypothetical protein
MTHNDRHVEKRLGDACAGFLFHCYSRASKRDREQIRSVFGFRRGTVADAEGLGEWLRRDVLFLDHNPDHLQQAALDCCRRNRIEPSAPPRMERIIRSAQKAYEEDFFAASHAKMPKKCRTAMDRLLQVAVNQDTDGNPETSPFAELRADPGRPSLKTLLLIQMVHRISARAERKVVKTLLEDLRKVHGKTTLLYRIAEAAVEAPDGIVRKVLYPIANEQTLRNLVRQFKATGPAYRQGLRITMARMESLGNNQSWLINCRARRKQSVFRSTKHMMP